MCVGGGGGDDEFKEDSRKRRWRKTSFHMHGMYL